MQLKKFAVVALLASTSSVIVAPEVHAQSTAARHATFDIPAGDLASALRKFSRQARVEVIFRASELRGRRTSGVRGALPAREALDRIVAGSGAELVRDASGAFLVRLPGGAAAGQGVSLGQVAGSSASLGEDPAGSAAANDGSAGSEIVVTGSRLRGAEVSPMLESFDRRRIEDAGASDVAAVLRYTSQQPFSFENRGSASYGANYVQLRGLPVGGALVLLNGRRVPLSAKDIGSNGFDLNLIPLAAVERVDVLSDSASAVYGADAVGGVVNIVTRKSVDRPTIDLRYQDVPGHAPEYRASLTFGLNTNRFRSVFVIDALSREPLLGSERSLWANQDYRRFGGTDARITNANPAAIVSATAANLPGLSSRFATIRPGVSGRPVISDFTAAPTEAALNSVSPRSYENIVQERKQYSGAAFAEYDLSDTAHLYAETLYTDTAVKLQTTPDIASLTVPADNPFNPFGVPVVARYLFEGVGPKTSSTDEDLLSVTVGTRGDIGRWQWDFSGQWAVSNSKSTLNLNAVNATQARCLLTDPATRTAGACLGINEALNVFGGPGGSAALLASLVATPTLNSTGPGFSSARSTTKQANGLLRGPLFNLPAGNLEVVIGGNWIEEHVEREGNLDSGRDAYAAFGEARIPIITSSMNLPLVFELTGQVAARYDSYSDFGDTFNAQYGLSWRPIRDLRLFASYGTSFSPPALAQLYAPIIQFPIPIGGLPDPLRNNEILTGTILLTAGGNPGLEPEKGKSFSAGAELKPAAIPGLRLSASYWDLKLDNRVATFGPADIILNPGTFANQITRAAPTPADVTAGLPGKITGVSLAATNFPSIETSGVDFGLSYNAETGIGGIATNITATWVDKFITLDNPSVGRAERAGQYSVFGSIPSWKVVGSVGWTGEWARITPVVRYSSSVKTTTGRLSAQAVVDINTVISLPKLFGRNELVNKFDLGIGARNLFNKMPQFVAGSLAFDQSLANLTGRMVYVTLSTSF